MKTFIEWFELLPEPYKTRAIRNANSQQRIDINIECAHSMFEAINQSMIWSNTPEGSEYWSELTEIWDNENNVIKVPLIYSTSMREMLNSIKSESVIARLLSSNSYTNTQFANYITMRGEMCSYLPHGREHKMNESGKWMRDGRQEMKPSKMARKLLIESVITNNDVTDVDFEKFTNCVKSYISVMGDEDGDGKKINFKIVSGEYIKFYYLADRYSNILGTDTNLHGSCMRYEECQDYLDLYADNVDIVSMLVALDKDDKVLGRAILWKLDDGDIAMDTIYAHESLVPSFVAYANENDFFYKSRQSCHHDVFDKHLTKSVSAITRVTLKYANYDLYPYMDTLCFLNGKELSNDENITDEHKKLKCTDGGYEDIDNCVFDSYNDRRVPESDARYLDYMRPNGGHFDGYVDLDSCVDTSHDGWVLLDDCVEVDGEYVLRDNEDIIFLDYLNEWHWRDNLCITHDDEYIHTDDAITLQSGEICFEEECARCMIDGEMYLLDDMVKVENNMIARCNMDEYKQILSNIKNLNNERRAS